MSSRQVLMTVGSAALLALAFVIASALLVTERRRGIARAAALTCVVGGALLLAIPLASIATTAQHVKVIDWPTHLAFGAALACSMFMFVTRRPALAVAVPVLLALGAGGVAWGLVRLRAWAIDPVPDVDPP